ncbi:MAG: WbuC family cupin fold metalloprotein [Opitutales bacterium]|nr:WbuC family cupin fold metalloprotein [Opitutales bacterium]
MKIISQQILDDVHAQAKVSPRLRMNYNLHETMDENVHKLVNSLQPGTLMPIHRHLRPPKKETFVMLAGALELKIYNDDGSVRESHILSRESGNLVAEIMPDEWHSFTVLEPDTAILEIKPGPYLPFQDIDLLPAGN